MKRVCSQLRVLKGRGSDFSWSHQVGLMARTTSGQKEEERMVGASGFEPPASWSRIRCQTWLKPVETWCVESYKIVYNSVSEALNPLSVDLVC